MSRFNVGDRVRWAGGEWEIRDSVEINGVVKHVVGNPPFQIFVPDDQCVAVPVPFLPDGRDEYINIYEQPAVVACFWYTLDAARTGGPINKLKVGIVKVDGVSGQLSWVEGGPQ